MAQVRRARRAIERSEYRGDSPGTGEGGRVRPPSKAPGRTPATCTPTASLNGPSSPSPKGDRAQRVPGGLARNGRRGAGTPPKQSTGAHSGHLHPNSKPEWPKFAEPEGRSSAASTGGTRPERAKGGGYAPQAKHRGALRPPAPQQQA